MFVCGDTRTRIGALRGGGAIWGILITAGGEIHLGVARNFGFYQRIHYTIKLKIDTDRINKAAMAINYIPPTPTPDITNA